MEERQERKLIELIEAGIQPHQAARQLSIPYDNLNRWLHDYRGRVAQPIERRTERDPFDYL